MWWRIPEGERFEQIHGAEAKRRQKALVLAGRSRGLLAFADSEPVGWCAYGRRTEFAVLARSRTLAWTLTAAGWPRSARLSARTQRAQ